jgi:hypothetical protein
MLDVLYGVVMCGLGVWIGWTLGRREFAYWLVRHPNWTWLEDELNDGTEIGTWTEQYDGTGSD